MARTFNDDAFNEWEAYVSGGQPGTPDAARIMFVCRSDAGQRPRYVRHESGDPAEAERDLHAMDESALLELFRRSEPIP